MQLAWVVYILLLSIVAGVAAHAADRVLRHFRRPTRWVWVAALAASSGLPLTALAFPGVADDLVYGFDSFVEEHTGGLEPATHELQQLQWSLVQDLPDLHTLFLGASLLAVAGASLWLLHGYRTLNRRRRQWEEGEVDGRACFFSDEDGPAIVGVLRHRLVLPAWIRDLSAERREMVLAHEAEHLRSRDPWLLAVAYGSLVCFPWNPVLWWQVRRLRLAVEVDCDRRVAAGRDGLGRASYGELLLEMGRAGRPAPATAFARGESHVGERIRELMEPTRLGAVGVAVRSVGALLLAVLLLTIPHPVLPLRDEGPTATLQELPHTVADVLPSCLNCDRIKERVRSSLVASGRGVHDGGAELGVAIRVTEGGRADRAVFPERVAHARDEEVLGLVRTAALASRWEPARVNGEPTPTWLFFTLDTPE